MKRNHAIFRLSSLPIVLVLLLTSIFSAAQAEPFLPGGWVKAAGIPLLSPGSSGAWDDQWVYAPSVILDGSTYKMWYVSFIVASLSRKIGYATSPDGNTWTKVGTTPVLSPGTAGSWDASNLVPVDTNNSLDVFLYDLQSGDIRIVSTAYDGSQGDWDSMSPSVSADGRFVAFGSSAHNLVADDTNNKRDIFVCDGVKNIKVFLPLIIQK